MKAYYPLLFLLLFVTSLIIAERRTVQVETPGSIRYFEISDEEFQTLEDFMGHIPVDWPESE